MPPASEVIVSTAEMARGLGISPLVDDPNERTAHALVNQSHELVAQRVLKQMQVCAATARLP